jgi:hypothetical protein
VLLLLAALCLPDTIGSDAFSIGLAYAVVPSPCPR